MKKQGFSRRMCLSERKFYVSREENGKTVGDFLRLRGVSRRLISKLKKTDGGITLCGKNARTVDTVSYGNCIALKFPPGKPLEANPELLAPTVFENESVVVYDKPVNMPVHPSQLHGNDTLGNLFAAQYGELTFRPITRLDKDTSGLCAVAKNGLAAAVLSGKIEKSYYAVVCGRLLSDGCINAPIGRCDGSVITREVRADGKSAITNYTVLKTGERYTLVKVFPETGRTHQIRVHFAYIGFPLAGDDMYGGSCRDTVYQALHCGEMRFTLFGEDINLTSNIREDMEFLVNM